MLLLRVLLSKALHQWLHKFTKFAIRLSVASFLFFASNGAGIRCCTADSTSFILCKPPYRFCIINIFIGQRESSRDMHRVGIAQASSAGMAGIAGPRSASTSIVQARAKQNLAHCAVRLDSAPVSAQSSGSRRLNTLQLCAASAVTRALELVSRVVESFSGSDSTDSHYTRRTVVLAIGVVAASTSYAPLAKGERCGQFSALASTILAAGLSNLSVIIYWLWLSVTTVLSARCCCFDALASCHQPSVAAQQQPHFRLPDLQPAIPWLLLQRTRAH